MKLGKLLLTDKREKGKFIEVVRRVVVFEDIGRPPWVLVRYRGARPKTQFANYILDNMEKIRKSAKANKENIKSKNLVYEIEYPPGKQEKKNYILKMPDLGILESGDASKKKLRDIEHEFYSNVYLYELLEYPVEFGFEPGQKIVPLPSCLILNEKTGEVIFLRTSVINTPLSIIAGERVSDVVAENTIKNCAVAAAMLTRVGVHPDIHFANVGVDFSSNRCSVVFFDLEDFIPLEEIRKRELPNKIFSFLSSLILVLAGIGIIRTEEQVRMFKDTYLDVNREWIRETDPKIFNAVMRETPFLHTDKEIKSYHEISEGKFRNLANPDVWTVREIAKRINTGIYLFLKAMKLIATGRL